MSDAVLIGGYIIGFLVTVPVTRRWWYEEQEKPKRQRDSDAAIMFYGLFCSLIWPVIWVGAWVAGSYRRRGMMGVAAVVLIFLALAVLIVAHDG